MGYDLRQGPTDSNRTSRRTGARTAPFTPNACFQHDGRRFVAARHQKRAWLGLKRYFAVAGFGARHCLSRRPFARGFAPGAGWHRAAMGRSSRLTASDPFVTFALQPAAKDQLRSAATSRPGPDPSRRKRAVRMMGGRCAPTLGPGAGLHFLATAPHHAPNAAVTSWQDIRRCGLCLMFPSQPFTPEILP